MIIENCVNLRKQVLLYIMGFKFDLLIFPVLSTQNLLDVSVSILTHVTRVVIDGNGQGVKRIKVQ
jgi:hypothetical protein